MEKKHRKTEDSSIVIHDSPVWYNCFANSKFAHAAEEVSYIILLFHTYIFDVNT